MLRIVTTLRNAFERPPEREGRELCFAKKPGDEREEMAMGEESGEKPATDQEEGGTLPPIRERTHEEVRGTVGSGEEPREEAPESGDGGERGAEGELHAGEEAREREEKMRLRAEQLVEKANQALEKIKKIRAVLMDEDFMEKIREAARRDARVRDLLTSLEGDRDTCTTVENDVLDLRRAAEQCVLWQDPIEQTSQPQQFLEAMATARAKRTDLDPEEEERKAATLAGYRGRTDVSDIEARWDTKSLEEKAPFIEEFKNLADFDDMLGKMDDMLTSYNAALDEYLALIEKLRADLEKGKVPEPPQTEWGGDFTLKLIHFVYLAMAVKKIYDTWKKQWEYDFERAVGECAAAISPWVAPREVTQRLLEEEEANIRKIKEEKKKEYEKYSFEKLHTAILTPDKDPAIKMAQLEVAAERGWLYGITEEGSALTVLGQPLSNFVPRSWRKNPSIIAEYHRKLQSININGESTKRKEGAASGSRNKGTPQALIDIRNIILTEKDYFKAIGMLEWAFRDKVDIGEIGASLFATIMECIAIDPLFAKVVRRYPDILKEAGKIAGGYPSQILFFLKIKSATLQKLANIAEQRGGIDLNNLTVLREIEDRFLDEPIISTYFRIRRNILEKGNVRREEVYASELGIIPAEDIPDAVALNRAIGKVMECQTITTATGEKIDIADDSYTRYRDAIEAGDPRMTWRLDMKTGMDESYGTQNSLSLMKDAYLRQLFVVNTNGEVAGGTYASNTINNIAKRYYDLRQLAQADPKYKKWLRNFIQDTQKRFCSTQGPGYAMFTHDRFHDVEQLTFTDKKTGKAYGIRTLITAGIITKKDLEKWIAATSRPAPAATKLLDEINNGKIPIDLPL